MSKHGGSQLWTAFSKHLKERKGEILFGSIMGSRRYNLAIEGSDLDMVVVYLPSIEVALGAKPDLQTFKQHDCLRPDFSVSSLEHFCSLLLQGDAKSVELLYTHISNVFEESADWAALQALRTRFITKLTVLNYSGELKGAKGLKKLTRLIKEGNNTQEIDKCAYILYRIASLGIRFSQRHPNPVWFESGEDDYETLMAIRRGAFKPQELLTMVEKRIETLQESFEQCSLQAQTDDSLAEELKNWYLNVRQKRTKMLLTAPAPSERFSPQLPGNELCLYSDYAKNAFFGVYVLPLPVKLWQLVLPADNSTIKFSMTGADGSNSEYLFYELDRLVEAFSRSEISAIMLIRDTDRMLFCAPSWPHLAPILPNAWTHTLVYTACGYISGRFKACRGDFGSKTVGFSSLEVVKRVEFAECLLSTAIVELKSRDSTGAESTEGLESLLKEVQNISRISSSLCTHPADEASLKELKDISNTFSADFVSLRPDFSRLFKSEIDFEKLNPWLVQSRVANEST